MGQAPTHRIEDKQGGAMPKWKKEATEFTVGVNFSEGRGYQTTIPKPVAEALGEPKAITYTLKGKKAEVKAAQ